MPPVGDVVRTVAVSGARLAGGWSRHLGRTQPPLAATTDFSPTAEVPQSPKHEIQCPATRSPRRNIATVTWEFPKSLHLSSVWDRLLSGAGGEGYANYNL